MIKTVNLQKIFKTEEVQTLALNDVNMEVKEGEFVAIMGPSGCGKSTLLNILGLLDNPTSGEYYLNGTEVSKYTEAQRTNLRKGVIGFVFQSFNLIDELNVYENIELPLLYMLSELNKEGTTIVMVTHSQHDAGFAKRIINLFDGQVVTEANL